MEKATLSVNELAKHMGIGRNQAYALTRREGFPALHIGTRILIPIKELENWLRREAEATNVPGTHRV
jgi:excisionase family DNA binding protein